MTEPPAFGPGIVERLRTIEEIDIETWKLPAAPHHRTIIWVVVDDAGRVLIRTYLGPESRWYREIVANPDCVVWLDGEAVPVRAEPAAAPAQVTAASRGYEAKYAGHQATGAMLAELVLPTTLELKPR
jgi:hypothetical protein